jgi:hypothetical protein
MNCEEIQSRFSEYLERSLDAADMKGVEDHLQVCVSCSVEAEKLALCIEQVSNLPQVEPPIGFAQRVMAHVREIETKPSFWKGLFSPRRIKIPLQASAVIVVGIFAVYLLEKDTAQKNLSPRSPAAVSEAAKKIPQQPAAPAEKQKSIDSEPSEAREASPGPAAKPAAIALNNQRTSDTKDNALATASISPQSQRKATVVTEAIALGPSKISEAREETASLPSAVEQKGRAIGIAIGTPVANQATGQARAGGGALALPVELKARPVRIEPEPSEAVADYELVVRRRPSQPEPTRRDAENSLGKSTPATSAERQVQGSSVDQLLAPIPESSKPQTVWVNLRQRDYEQFKKDLLTSATIESETIPAAGQKEIEFKIDGELRVKLTILPTASPERANPVSPNSR